MFKVGDIIQLEDKVGRITAVHTDKRIGFLLEGNRHHTYDIEFTNIPEEEIELRENGSIDAKSNDPPEKEEGECREGWS